jgi:hypothetical protein
MFNILLVVILSTTATNSLNCMELGSKKNGKSRSAETKVNLKRKNYRNRKSVSSSSIPKTSLNTNPITPIFPTDKSENGFITAVSNNDLPQVLDFLHNNCWFNPNIKENNKDRGNTALHYAALRCHPEILGHLLKDPRVDSSIRNAQGTLAQQLLTIKNNDDELDPVRAFHRQLFVRYPLDIAINKAADDMRSDYFQGKYPVKALDAKAEEIRTKIINVHTSETQDAEIPKAAQFSNCATIEWVRNMLVFRISNKQGFNGN